MIREIDSTKFGKIVYEESFWSGKKRVTINGIKLKKVSKTTYTGIVNEQVVKVTIMGNFLRGCYLYVDDEYYLISEAAAWYEYVLGMLPLLLVIIWGNSVTLCSIIPVVGGAIGGAIAGLASAISLFVMKKMPNFLLKIAVGLGVLIATFAICAGIGYSIVSIF